VLLCPVARRFLESWYARVPANASANQAPEIHMDMQMMAGASVGGEPSRDRALATDASRGKVARGGEDVESQYRRMYEDRVNPFTDFSRYGTAAVLWS
jgi:hypothetical protein